MKHKAHSKRTSLMQHMILTILGICLFFSNQNNAKYFLLYFKGKYTCKSFSWQCLFPPGLFHLKPLQSLFKVFNGGGITNKIKGKNFCHRRVLIMEIIQTVIPTPSFVRTPKIPFFLKPFSKIWPRQFLLP